MRHIIMGAERHVTSTPVMVKEYQRREMTKDSALQMADRYRRLVNEYAELKEVRSLLG